MISLIVRAPLSALAALALVLLLSGCGAPAEREEESAGRLKVFVSIPPQAYLVERIGGGLVEVEVLVQPGQEPHTFEPTPRQVMSLGRARLYFGIGMPFEEQLIGKFDAELEALEIVDSSAGVERLALEGGHEHHHHGEEEGGEHGEGLDPHIWLDPARLKLIAGNIAAALESADPANSALYAANLDALVLEIDALDAEVSQLLEPHRGRSFVVAHGAFGYFAHAYGLRQVAVELEGKSPTPRQLEELIEQAREEGIDTVFVQPQFDPASADAVAEALGGEVVPLDALARDAVANLREIATKIDLALRRR